jgi:hypothetical protein
VVGGHQMTWAKLDELLSIRAETNRVRADFLKTDLQTALTFVKIAHQTEDDLRRIRSKAAARKAYDTVVNLLPKIPLTAEDNRLVKQTLKRLQLQLKALGETF